MAVEALHRFTGEEHRRLVEAGGLDARCELIGGPAATLPLDVVGAEPILLRAVREHARR